MERLILEVPNRNLHQYHHIDSFPTTIGRAYDNDIILSHRSISPHHMVIDKDESGKIIIKNLSKENGSAINKNDLGEEPVAIDSSKHNFSASIRLGQIKTRLVSSSTQIDATLTKDCDGWFCFLNKPFWSVTLILLAWFTITFNEYLNTQSTQNIFYYLKEPLSVFLGLFAIIVLMSGITKLVTHCWQFYPILAMGALLVLIPELFHHTGHFLNYLLTDDAPLKILSFLSNYLLLPLLLFVFVGKINRYPAIPALGLSILVSAPFILYQTYEIIDKGSFGDEFSDQATYNQTLSFSDVRLKPTTNIDDFINRSHNTLEMEMKREIRLYEQKNGE